MAPAFSKTASSLNASGGTVAGPGNHPRRLLQFGGTVLPGRRHPQHRHRLDQRRRRRTQPPLLPPSPAAAITNAGTIQGLGTVGSPVTNSSGTIESIGGTLVLAGSLTNSSTGTITSGSNSKILVSSGLNTNAGLINLTGGTFDNNNHPLTNTGQISGFGIFRSGGLTNNGSITFSGTNGSTTTVN